MSGSDQPPSFASLPIGADRGRCLACLRIVLALAFCLVACPAPTLAADVPEVVRLRVPTDKVKGLFPPGTELRVLPREELERVERAARASAALGRSGDGPGIVRARHEARWEGDTLIGRSELLVEGAADPEAVAILDPWSPALVRTAPPTESLRVGPDRRLGLRVGGAAPRTVSLSWEQRARPGSRGRAFDLALPAVASCRLALDLPAEVVPDAAGMLRRGPAPASRPDRRAWRFDGPGGVVRLRLRSPGDPSDPAGLAWVEGTTRVDATSSPARWQADWLVDPGVSGPRRLALELDPGLELIDVTGPGVASYRSEPATADAPAAGTLVSVRLDDAAAGPSRVSVRALARVADDGPWTIPSARPSGATWTGGRTVVRLGPGQVVSSVRERAGRQVAPRAEEREEGGSRGGLVLAFEATAPRPVADLTLERSPSQLSAEVRGRLLLSTREAARIEAQVTWKVERGRLLVLSADLPAGWAPERAQVRGSDEPTAWHAEARPGGGTRLVARPPPSPDPKAPLTLDISAVATSGQRLGPIDLPRVLPPEARVADEVWVARAEPGLAVAPATARGLAWLDPATTGFDPPKTPAPPDPSRPVLAWRWTAADGRASLARSPSAAPRRAEAWVLAEVAADRLTLDLYLAVSGEARLSGDLIVATTEPLDEVPRWEVAAEPGRAVEAVAIPPADRAASGLPEGGSAWRLPVPRDGRDRVVLHARAVRPWNGRGAIPLLVVPPRDFARGTLLVSAGRGLRSAISAPGLTTYDAAWARRAAAAVLGAAATGGAEAEDSPRIRSAHALGYGEGSTSVGLTTETLPAASSGGVVQEATLRTRPGGPGRTLHRLSLRVVAGPDRAIDLSLPEAATLERVEVEGRPASPIREGDGLRFALPPSTPERPTADLRIDYLGPFRPELPRCSLPVLGFSWGVEPPAGEELTPGDPSLTPTDPPTRRAPSRGLAPRWLLPGDRLATEGASALRELDERVRRDPPGGLALGDWLARLDGGRVPIVVDRAAMADAGLGPRSRPSPSRGGPATASARDVFASIGLDATPIGGVVLVSAGPPPDLSSDAEARQAWSEAMRDASAVGHDATDRFQAVPRWRGEPTPGPAVSASVRDDSGARGVAPRRFAASGRPAAGVSPILVDPAPRRLLSAAIAAAACVLLGPVVRLGARSRIAAPGIALAAGLGLASFGPRGWVEPASALAWGGAAASALWLGAASRRKRPDPRPPGRSWPPSRGYLARGGSGVVAAMAVAVVLRAETAARPVEGGHAEPIVAVLPYDPPFDPGREASDAILRVADFDLLKALAEADPPRADAPSLAGALHEVRREGLRDARIASAFDLWSPSPGPASWSFPVEGARELTASLDGRDVPIAIGPAGRTGLVEVVGPGAHRLVLRRLAALGRVDGVDRLALPVPPMAAARFRAEVAPGAGVPELPTARGREILRGSVLDAALGPIESLEVIWPDRGATGPPQPRGSVSTLALWDVEPAGDRVRLRVTATAPEGLSRIAARLGPGVVVRSAGAPGVAIDASTRAVGEGSAWEAALEPRLGRGESASIELWSPVPDPFATRRRLPEFEVLGPSEAPAVVGVRRPEDWTGRLDPADGFGLVADDAFARDWGALPPGPATLAGAARVSGGPTIALETGPPKARARVRPSVLLELAPGRLDVAASATWAEPSGTAREVVVAVPGALRIARVESPGLTDWAHASGDRLRLRFDAERPPPSRTILIQGWVPIDGDPLAPGPSRGEIDAPWPTWPDAEVEPGLLTIAAPPDVTFRLAPNAGVAPTATDPVAGPSFRAAFSVPPRSSPGLLRWAVEPTGVTVNVRSLVTLHPGAAEWTASARYAVPWGPCPAVRLRLPTAWADASRAEIVGSKAVPKVDRGAETTTWTFVPDPPAWGGLRVLIRGLRPRSPASMLPFPDLAPLGRAAVDRVDSYLGYADASGGPTVVEGSAELQAVDGSRWDADDLPWPPGLGRNVYRVVRGGWSLRFGPPGEPGGAAPSPDGPTVLLADLSCTIAEDGSILGRASYDLAGRPSAFLALGLPDGAEPLAAAVDGLPLRPRRDGSGRILIPLPDAGAGRVLFAWRGRPGPAVGGRHAVGLPALEAPDVPTLVSVSAPETIAVASGAAEVPIAAAELARADRLAKAIADRLPALDRGSATDLSALLAECVRFELRARAAIRAAGAANPTGARPIVEAMDRVRAGLAEALAGAGLEDYSRSARVRVGLAERDPLPSLATPDESPDLLRVRPLGPTRAFRSATSEPGRAIAISWTKARGSQASRPSWLPPAIAASGCFAAVLLALKRPRLAALGATLASALALVAAGGGLLASIVLPIAWGIGRVLPVFVSAPAAARAN